MMSDDTDLAIPKIIDFGLARVIGPTMRSDEPFGTLGYVAPEVLKKEPYSFSCDVWSIGCICYALLSGSLPFDHQSPQETVRMTLKDPLLFDLPCWKLISDKAQNFITGCLVKDPTRRLTIDQVIKHPWFSKNRTNVKKSSNFS
jgi:serine/threonine protein kinase